MWRNLRRMLGYWIAGAEPAAVHCSNCGHITKAWCTKHRDQLVQRTREMPKVMSR